jgi:hypothetical protein
MNNQEFENNTELLYQKIKDILNLKGVEYQNNKDVFSNFKDNAERLGLSKYQIWTVYFNKHVGSINNAVKNNPYNPNDINKIENLESRVLDAMAYLFLLHGMIYENKDE